MSLAKYRTMVVDDSPAILVVMQAIMTELGIDHVTTCSSAVSAAEKVRQTPHQFDVIFTDLNMPEMDGMEFIRQLGELKFSGAIIIISEMDEKIIDLATNLARQSNAHLIGNISKPVQLVDVERMLKKMATYTTVKRSHIEKVSESDLLQAISNNEITPYYQPKVHRGEKR